MRTLRCDGLFVKMNPFKAFGGIYGLYDVTTCLTEVTQSRPFGGVRRIEAMMTCCILEKDDVECLRLREIRIYGLLKRYGT